MRPFLSFYGSKWRAAPRYPAPLHRTIVEPFAGAAGYSIRYADRDVVLVEKDPIIASVWEYLISATADEIMDLPLLSPGQHVDSLPIVQSARWLIGFWLNAGSAGPRKTLSKWARSETASPGAHWGAPLRARLASQVGRIKHWRVMRGSYEDAPRITDATYFVDPPYQHAGRHYRCGSGEIDFAALGAWCRALPGQVVVCENEGADWLPFRPFAQIKSNHANNRTGATHSSEVIWTNDQ